MSDADLAQRVYRLFGTEPLKPEQEDLYVDLEQARGDMHVADRLERRIRFAEGSPTCQVLAGHKGSGKSTELLRLKKRLEDESPQLFVVYVRAGDDIDYNDVDFPDVLIAIVRQTAAQLQQHAGITLAPGYFKKRWERLKEIGAAEINFESFGLEVGMLNLAGQIKDSPNARAEIRKALEPDTNNWISAANDVIGQAVGELAKQGKQGLVILVDELDKIVVREHVTGCKTDEQLFVNRAAQLTSFHCHVVYTMPLSLAYSHQERAIRNLYGGDVPVVPMTKIAEPPPSTKRYLPGFKRFREMIAKRLKKADAKKSEVFLDDGIRDELIALSGGQPTELMTLVREAIIAHELPIDGKSLDRARIEGQREYARQLLKEHWPIIEEVRRNADFVRTKDNDATFRELLEGRAILQYLNGGVWYGLNPVVATLEAPPTDESTP